MAQAPAFTPSSAVSTTTATDATRPAAPPHVPPSGLAEGQPVMVARPPVQAGELSFAALFLFTGSDRPERKRDWLNWLPPLAATLHQLTLADIDDDVRSDHALQAIQDCQDLGAADERYGRTVLHWACLLAHPDLVDLLLRHGLAAQVNQPDAQGHSPLDCVQALRPERGAARVADLLLSYGASLATLSHQGAELLYLPDLDVPLARRLLGLGVAVDGGDAYGTTPLATACGRGLWGVASVLLEFGADVLRPGPFGSSALHNGHLPVWLAEQLYRSGAEPNARDLTGDTPLMLAHAEGNQPLIRWLVAKGAQQDAVADDGLRAIDFVQPPGSRYAGRLQASADRSGTDDE